jgi:uncharacterized membrane protein
MGSFTSNVALQIMRAVFPSSTTALAPITATTTTAANFRIYNSHVAAGSQWGIFSAGANVVHTCHLVFGSVAATGANIAANNLNDSNFQGTPSLGTISGSFANVGGNCSFGTGAAGNYFGYTGKAMVASGGTTHTWQGWSLSETSSKGQAQSNLQIGFPALGATSGAMSVYGFVITAQGTDAAPSATNPASQLVASNNGGAPLIIAYGDLSASRLLNEGDTPVFATQAITITLE